MPSIKGYDKEESIIDFFLIDLNIESDFKIETPRLHKGSHQNFRRYELKPFLLNNSYLKEFEGMIKPTNLGIDLYNYIVLRKNLGF